MGVKIQVYGEGKLLAPPERERSFGCAFVGGAFEREDYEARGLWDSHAREQDVQDVSKVIQNTSKEIHDNNAMKTMTATYGCVACR